MNIQIVSLVLSLLLVVTCISGNVAMIASAGGVISAGTMSAHPNGYNNGMYFTMAANENIPYGTGWDVRYVPTTTDAIQRIRGGETTNEHLYKYVCEEDRIHLSKQGAEACAKQVADVIKQMI